MRWPQSVRSVARLGSFLSLSEGLVILSLAFPDGRGGVFPPSEVMRSAVQGLLGEVNSIEDRSSVTMPLFKVEYSDERQADLLVAKRGGQLIEPLGLIVRCNYSLPALVSPTTTPSTTG